MLRGDRDKLAYWNTLKAQYEQDKRDLEAWFDEIDEHNTLPKCDDYNRLKWLHGQLQDGNLANNLGADNQPSWYVDDMRYMNAVNYYETLPYEIKRCNDHLQAIMEKQLKDRTT